MDLEILQDYLVESKELLQKAQEETLRLEAEPGNDEALASIFRAFHTIKGGAGFLEADHLVEWAHDLEELLDKLRSHSLPVTSARIDAILKGIDVIEIMFQQLAEERPPDIGAADLSRTIRALAVGESSAPESQTESQTACVAAAATLAAANSPIEDAGHAAEPVLSAGHRSQLEPEAAALAEAGPRKVATARPVPWKPRPRPLLLQHREARNP